MKFGSNLLFFSLLLFCISELPAKKWAADLPTGNLETLQQQAASSQQPYLVYLFRKGDRDCKRMNKKTWSDPTLKQYLGQHYLVQQQEVMDMQMEWVDTYHLYDWPAILIFHPEGRLMGRIDGFVAPKTLVSILQKHIRSLEHERRTAYLALVEKQEQQEQIAQMPTAEEVLSPAVAVQDMNLQVQSMRTRGEQKVSLLQTVEGMEEHSLRNLPELPAQQPTYGLLLGAFTSYKDLKYQVQKIQKFWRGQIWVYAEETEGNPVYKLAIGAYEDRETAESFANAIYRFERINASILNLQLLKD